MKALLEDDEKAAKTAACFCINNGHKAFYLSFNPHFIIPD